MGNMKCMIVFAFALLLMFIVSFADERAEDTFFVKPQAQQLDFETKLKDYKCKFTYKAAGGTHEEWAISLELLDEGRAVMCTVERGIPSYLFFENFKMELTGPGVSITDIDVKDFQRDNKSLQPEEYKLEATSIASVPDKFKNHLEKVAVYSPLEPREDL